MRLREGWETIPGGQRINAVGYDSGFTRLLKALQVEPLPLTTKAPAPETPVIQAASEPLTETLTAATVEPPPMAVEQPAPETYITEVFTDPVTGSVTVATVEPLPLTAQQVLRLHAKQVLAELLTAQRVSIATQSRTALTLVKQTLLTVRLSLIGTLIGAAVGFIWGIIIAYLYSVNWMDVEIYTGIGGAITGAINGMDRKMLTCTFVGIIVTFSLWLRNDPGSDDVLNASMVGTPLGAISGALVGVVLKKLWRWT